MVEREEREVFVRQTVAFVRNIFESDIDINDVPDEVPDDKADKPDSAKEIAIVNDLQRNVSDKDLGACEDDFSNLESLPLGISLKSFVVS